MSTTWPYPGLAVRFRHTQTLKFSPRLFDSSACTWFLMFVVMRPSLHVAALRIVGLLYAPSVCSSITVREWGVIIRSVPSVCVSVCTVLALTLQRLDLQTIFLICRCVFIIYRSVLSIKVMGQGQGRTSVTKYTRTGGLLRDMIIRHNWWWWWSCLFYRALKN